MDKEKIIKLLKSPNTEDQMIGVNLAVTKLGKNWCKDNFMATRFPSKSNILIKYSDFEIFVGNDYIEFYQSNFDRVSPEDRFSEYEPINIILENE